MKMSKGWKSRRLFVIGGGPVDGFEMTLGGSDLLHLWLEEVYEFPERTSYFGGYDARGTVAIHCGPFRVHDSLSFSTGEVWQFYTELLKAYNDLAGEARFRSSEGNLEFTLRFGWGGHFLLKGTYQAVLDMGGRLQFDMGSDQSYLAKPLAQLAQFVAKYGDNRGLHQ